MLPPIQLQKISMATSTTFNEVEQGTGGVFQLANYAGQAIGTDGASMCIGFYFQASPTCIRDFHVPRDRLMLILLAIDCFVAHLDNNAVRTVPPPPNARYTAISNWAQGQIAALQPLPDNSWAPNLGTLYVLGGSGNQYFTQAVLEGVGAALNPGGPPPVSQAGMGFWARVDADGAVESFTPWGVNPPPNTRVVLAGAQNWTNQL